MNHPLHDRCRLVGAVWFQRTSTNTSSMYMCISACAALVNPSHTERGTTVEQMPADTEKQNVPNQIGAIGACWQPVGNLSMPKVCWDVHRAWRAHVRLEGLGHRANFPERPFFSWDQANKQNEPEDSNAQSPLFNLAGCIACFYIFGSWALFFFFYF